MKNDAELQKVLKSIDIQYSPHMKSNAMRNSKCREFLLKNEFHPPEYFLDLLMGSSFNNSFLILLSKNIHFACPAWVIKAEGIIDILNSLLKGLLRLITPGEMPPFYEEDIIGLYKCLYRAVNHEVFLNKICSTPEMINLLLFSVIPSFTKQMSMAIYIIFNLMNNKVHFDSAMESLEVASSFHNSSSVFKWIIDTLHPSRGPKHCGIVVDLFSALLCGTKSITDRVFYQSIFKKDGLFNSIKLLQFFNNQNLNNRIGLLLDLIDRDQQSIIGMIGLSKTSGQRILLNKKEDPSIMIDPQDPDSLYESIKAQCLSSHQFNLFLYNLLDVSTSLKSTMDFLGFLNKFMFYCRVGLKSGMDHNKTIQKAVQVSLYEKNPLKVSNYHKYSNDDQNALYQCMREHTGNSWVCDCDLPPVPEEMKQLWTKEDQVYINQCRIQKEEKIITLESALKSINLKYEGLGKEIKKVLTEEQISQIYKDMDQIKVSEPTMDQVNDRLNNEIENRPSNTVMVTPMVSSAPPPPPPPPMGVPPPPPPMSNNRISIEKLPFKTKPFNFDTFPSARIQESIWSKLSIQNLNIDFELIKPLIENQSFKEAKPQKVQKQTVEKPSLIISANEEKLAICLSKLISKKLFFSSILLSFDWGDKIDNDSRASIISAIPNIIDSLKNNPGFMRKMQEDETGDLKPIEIELLRIMKTPYLPLRIKFLKCRDLDFINIMTEIQPLEEIISACQVMKQSTRFHSFLEIILFLGNKMNVSTGRTSYTLQMGLNLKTFERIADSKNLYLLRSIILIMKNSNKDLDFFTEFEPVIRASKYVYNDIEKRMRFFTELFVELKNFKLNDYRLSITHPDDSFTTNWDSFEAKYHTVIERIPSLLEQTRTELNDVIQLFQYSNIINDAFSMFDNVAALIKALRTERYNMENEERKKREFLEKEERKRMVEEGRKTMKQAEKGNSSPTPSSTEKNMGALESRIRRFRKENNRQ